MTEEKKTRKRDPKVYVVVINGETHFVRAKSKQTALAFAISETVTVRAATNADTMEMAKAISNGEGILEA